MKTTTPGACEDISTKCELYKQYCGENNYVTKRCIKTCGICSKFILKDYYLVKDYS